MSTEKKKIDAPAVAAPVAAAPVAAPAPDDDDEVEELIYDDGTTDAETAQREKLDSKKDDDVGEMYDDAGPDDSSPAEEEDDECIYEAYDDIMPEEDPTPKQAPPQLPDRNPKAPSKPLPASPPTPSAKDPDNYYESLYYGMWDCQGDSDDELEFKRGDVIQILSKTHCGDDWWVGKLNGSVGILPKEYVTPVYALVHW